MGLMLYYINQPCTPSFPTMLVKLNQNHRSVESDLEWLMLVVAVINADTFFTFSEFNFNPRDTRISDFWLHSINRYKYQGNSSVMLHMEVYPYSYLWCCWYSWDFWVSLVMTDEFLLRVTKITSMSSVSRTQSLPFWFCPLF